MVCRSHDNLADVEEEDSAMRRMREASLFAEILLI